MVWKRGRRFWQRAGLGFSILCGLVSAARFFGMFGGDMPDGLVFGLIGAGITAVVAVAIATFSGDNGPPLTADQVFKLEQRRVELRHKIWAEAWETVLFVGAAGGLALLIFFGVAFDVCSPVRDANQRAVEETHPADNEEPPG